MLEETFRVPWPHHHKAARERPLASPWRTSHRFPLSPLSSGHQDFVSVSLMLQAPSRREDFVPTPRSVFTAKLHGWGSSSHPTVSVTTAQTFVQPLSHLPTLHLGTALRSICPTCCLVFCVPVSIRENTSPARAHCPFPLCPRLPEHPLWGLQQAFDEWIDDCL